MTVALYLDHNIPEAVAIGLRARGVDVIMTRDDGRAASPDEEIFQRATELDRVLVTHDRDFFKIASDAQRTGRHFTGVVWSHSESMSIGELIEQLAMVALLSEPGDCRQAVMFLPL